MEDDKHLGRPFISRTEGNVEKINRIVRKYRELTVRMIAETLDIEKDTTLKILCQDLNIKIVFTKMVPRVLRQSKKEHSKEICACSRNIFCEAAFGQQTHHILEHLPYSPDLALRWFCLFPEMKYGLKGTCF